VDHEHLPAFVLGDPWHENRIIGSVPAWCWIDSDITGIRSLVEALAATVDAIASAIHDKTVCVAFLVAAANVIRTMQAASREPVPTTLFRKMLYCDMSVICRRCRRWISLAIVC